MRGDCESYKVDDFGNTLIDSGFSRVRCKLGRARTFGTIQAAIDDSGVVTGDRIIVGRGNHAGAFVTKEVEIRDDRYLG